MAEIADWTADSQGQPKESKKNWIKFVVGGFLILAAIGLLLITTTQGNAQYLLTVEEMNAKRSEMVGKDARVSGIVVPESIIYQADTLYLEFEIMDQVDESQEPLRIIMVGEPLPDQMKDKAEAVAEGRLGDDGAFYAETLMMKCTSKYDVEVQE
ncbi:MAG: cytochrome c maturation protein CcmE [Anaerolineales bacterium]|nr:cytochrome c maturation protein CcmE [Anaerolineales bacterium]